MRILHINCNYLDSWLHQNMVNGLENRFIDNSVCVPVYNKSNHIVKPANYVDVLECFKKWDRIWYQHKQNKIYKAVKNKYSIEKFSCIHAYTVFTDGNVARKLAKEYNIPYVVAVRNTDVNYFFKNMLHLRRIGIQVLREAKVVFFLSSAYKKEVFEKYIPNRYHRIIEEKSRILPNGIDMFWHNNLYVERNYEMIAERIEKKNLRIVYAGSIDKNKNVRLTCDAIKLLEKKGWDIVFTVVGNIKDKAVFKEIEDHVSYFEALPKEKLIDKYREADIFIMPSHTESFGLVYAEAMSQGLPVIYTRGQGFDGRYTEGEVGFSVSSLNSQELASKILKCVDAYEDRSKRCLKAVNEFRWNTICDSYLQIYQNIIMN